MTHSVHLIWSIVSSVARVEKISDISQAQNTKKI